MNRSESTNYDWPFQPWPGRGNTLGGWDAEAAHTGSVVSREGARRSRSRILLVLVAILTAALAGLAMAHWFVGDADVRASPESGLNSAASPDQHLAELVLEHRRAVYGP